MARENVFALAGSVPDMEGLIATPRNEPGVAYIGYIYIRTWGGMGTTGLGRGVVASGLSPSPPIGEVGMSEIAICGVMASG